MTAGEPRIPTEEEIQQFVRGLRADQFATTSTAVDGWADPVDPTDEEAFERFLREELEFAAQASAGVATLHDGERRRRYRITDGEGPPDFVERIRAEAYAAGAVWGFAAVPGEAAIGVGDVFDPTDLGQVARARRQGAMRAGLNWYAASVPTGTSAFGLIREEEDRIEIMRSTCPGGVAPYFRDLLPPF